MKGEAQAVATSAGKHVWRRRIAAVLTATSLIISACTVGPNYQRPIAITPPAYKELAGWKVAQPQDDTLRGAWWELFQDARLNALEEQVDIGNQNIAAAEAQVRQAQAAIQAARASYFPTLSVGANVVGARAATGSGSSARFARGAGYTIPLAASWEPDLWGRVRRSVESQRATAQATVADLETVRLTAQATLAQSYFALRVLDAEAKLLTDTVATYQRSLTLTQNRYAVGVASRGDVALAETQLKNTQAQLVDVGVQRAQLEHAIAVLIGEPASTFSLPVSPLTMAPPAIPVGVPSELLERRPDIAGAERRAAAANAQIGVAEAAFYPNLTLSGTVGALSTGLGNWPGLVWSLGAALSETVFEGGLRKAVTAEAWAAYDATVAAYRQTTLTAFQDVEDNLAAVRILAGEATLQDEAVAAAQQALTVLLNQYRAGTLSYLDVVVTQALVLSDERTAIDIYGRRMNATVLLIKALGGGWNGATLESGQ